VTTLLQQGVEEEVEEAGVVEEEVVEAVVGVAAVAEMAARTLMAARTRSRATPWLEGMVLVSGQVHNRLR
jgi:23S rRNA G2445 N2-methylase RlmL